MPCHALFILHRPHSAHLCRCMRESGHPGFCYSIHHGWPFHWLQASTSHRSMKIIFLDFDGVILTGRTMLTHPERSFSRAAPDPVLCTLLKRICTATGFKIVVSSTWRTGGERAKSKLFDVDLEEHLHEDWRTPDLNKGRAHEITDWLSRHPEVTDYRIIDDDDYMWPPEQRQRWLQCSSDDGMLFNEMRELAIWAGLYPSTSNIIVPVAP